MGLNPSAFAFSSDISSTAAAPSVSGDEFPAVIVPYLRSNTGRSFDSASSVESDRIRLSDSTIVSYDGGTTTVISSSLNRPLDVAAAARWWVRVAAVDHVRRSGDCLSCRRARFPDRVPGNLARQAGAEDDFAGDVGSFD